MPVVHEKSSTVLLFGDGIFFRNLMHLDVTHVQFKTTDTSFIFFHQSRHGN
jgi:hypothetical protein